jgi:hypothetical protein
MNPWAAAVVRPAPEGRRGERYDQFAAQMGAARRGRLRFTNGAHRVAIRADPDVLGLYRAPAKVGEAEQILKLQYLYCNTFLPARRASNVYPAEALRLE